jgi:hypothetical protein
MQAVVPMGSRLATAWLAALWLVACTNPVEPSVAQRQHPATGCDVRHEGDLKLRTAQDVLAAAGIAEIHGDLILGDLDYGPRRDGDDGAPLVVEPGQLRCLWYVTGGVMVGALVPTGRIVLDGLEVVDGYLAAGFVAEMPQQPARLEAPVLRRVGTPRAEAPKGVQIAESFLGGGVSLPSLQVVHGPLAVGSLLTPSLDLGSLSVVDGPLQVGPAETMRDLRMGPALLVMGPAVFDHLPQVPYSLLVQHVGEIRASAIEATGIGCARPDGDASEDCETEGW